MTALEARDKLRKFGCLATIQVRLAAAEREFKMTLAEAYPDDDLIVIFVEYLFSRGTIQS